MWQKKDGFPRWDINVIPSTWRHRIIDRLQTAIVIHWESYGRCSIEDVKAFHQALGEAIHLAESTPLNAKRPGK